MPTKGYDIFQLNPGSADSMICRVCGAKCDVQRNVDGFTSFGGAMMQNAWVHDCFACPHRREHLHNEALELMREMEHTHSPSLKEIMRKDLNAMVAQVRQEDLNMQPIENE